MLDLVTWGKNVSIPLGLIYEIMSGCKICSLLMGLRPLASLIVLVGLLVGLYLIPVDFGSGKRRRIMERELLFGANSAD